MRPKARPNYYASRRWPTVVKSVNVSITGTTHPDVWTPATGKKFQVTGYNLVAVVTTVLAGAEAAGNVVGLWDELGTVPVAILGVVVSDDLAAGSSFPGAQSDVAWAAIDETLIAPSTVFRPIEIPGGYTSTTANNDVKAGVSTGAAFVDLSTGVIKVMGTIWGHEVD